MKTKSIKKNYILNSFRVISGAAVGLITMPYINRVLGAEYIGKVEYVNTIINYFLLFTALGIPMYGIREIAKVREQPAQKARTLAELLVLLGVTSLAGYILLFGVLYQMDYFSNYKSILLIMSAMIFLTNIGAEWYFQGVEDQLYITIRYVGVRVLMVVLMFLFIKSPDNYHFYAFCIVLTTCGANILNFFVISKILYKEKNVLRNLNVKKHIKPALTIFIATISVSIYLNLDNLLIGTIAGDKYVGYYSVANKMIRFVISFITVIGAVMLPRLSFLFQEDKEQYFKYLHKSFTFLLLTSLPFTVYFLVFAKPIINLIAGSEFDESIITMKLISPLCLIVSMAYFMGFLILYPQNKEKVYTYATLISAAFSVCVNFFAVKYYQHNGAAVVGVLSELLAIVIMFFFLKRTSNLPDIFDKNFGKIIVASVIMLLVSLIGIKLFPENIFYFVLMSLISWLVYGALLYILKENEVKEIINKIKNAIIR
ncbi:flippase [Epilithonimonas sp. JDS]|uniref:flippase n=1 Tax=Epilithonimonas sp. JDS TaxID=2902797 RepID=UPI001E59F95D|nr:flippase [Epilithonimonas sp. JDS]MCD9853439.1 flippase [Epilithonimonas sp. JDS]